MEKKAEDQIDTKSLVAWMRQLISASLEIDMDEVDPEQPLPDMGVDSVMAVSLLMELETKLGKELDPMLLYTYPTINQLIGFVVRDKSH